MKLGLTCLLLAFSLAKTDLGSSDYTVEQKLISNNEWVELTITRTGTAVADNQYLAIGFGASMTNTDMVFCAFVGGKAVCEDRWSTGQTMPTKDTTQDITLTSSKLDTISSPKSMTFTVKRKLDTGDSTQDKKLSTSEKTKFIWAVGVAGGTQATPTYTKHTAKGVTAELTVGSDASAYKTALVLGAFGLAGAFF